jgi:hypothetical protein
MMSGLIPSLKKTSYLNVGDFQITDLGKLYVENQIIPNDGDESTPMFSFLNDQDTGWYREGENVLGLTLGGQKLMTFDSAIIDFFNQTTAQFGDERIESPNLRFWMSSWDGAVPQFRRASVKGYIKSEIDQDDSYGILFTDDADNGIGGLIVDDANNLTYLWFPSLSQSRKQKLFKSEKG